MLLIYPLGIPIIYAILVFRIRKKLNPQGEEREQIKKDISGDKDRTLEEEVSGAVETKSTPRAAFVVAPTGCSKVVTQRRCSNNTRRFAPRVLRWT